MNKALNNNRDSLIHIADPYAIKDFLSLTISEAASQLPFP